MAEVCEKEIKKKLQDVTLVIFILTSQRFFERHHRIIVNIEMNETLE